MAGKKPLAPDKKTDYFWVDSRKLIEEEGYNERENWGDIPGLAKEILAVGVQQSLIVNRRGEYYSVKSGNRRRLACAMLVEQGHGPIMVPCILERRGGSAEERILHQITDNSGLAFTPWENAKVMRRLRAFKWSDKEIAERSGKSVVYVRRLLSLADAPQKLINLVREGRVSATFAMDQIAAGKTEELIEAGEKMLTGGANPDDIGDLFTAPGVTAAPPAARITRSDVQRPNSLKIFKKWSRAVEEEKLSADKKELFQWLKRLSAGEVTLEDLQNYFS
jgi:ParB/RepB/Spo0J family partition protein